jgi:hypothetical protein
MGQTSGALAVYTSALNRTPFEDVICPMSRVSTLEVVGWGSRLFVKRFIHIEDLVGDECPGRKLSWV